MNDDILIALKPRRNRKCEVPKLVQEDMNKQTNIFKQISIKGIPCKKKKKYNPQVQLVLEVNAAKFPRIGSFLNYTNSSREEKKQQPHRQISRGNNNHSFLKNQLKVIY